MRDIIQDDTKAKAIVEEACGIKIRGHFSGLVFLDGTKIIGAAVFDNYNEWNVDFTCTLSEGDVGMRIVRRVAWYIFGVMKCHRCTAITKRDNVKALEALRKIGFVWEGVAREYFPGKADGFIFGLLRSEQRLLRRLG